MSHVPTVLKSDRSVFDKMLPVDDNDCVTFKQETLINVTVKCKYSNISFTTNKVLFSIIDRHM